MSRLIMSLFMFAVSLNVHAESRVRRVPVNGDQIVTVRTALGIATIIQVPDRPNSVVVGDQEAFKVEYLDQAITIKPIQGGAKSNLYVYTEWKRYNIQLVTGNEASADYVVYLENPKEKVKDAKPSLTWTPFPSKLSNGNVSLDVNRLGRTRDGILIVEFSLRASKKERVRPEWIWLTQQGGVIPIHNLFLSALELRPGDSVRGMMQILRSDLKEGNSFRVEMRREKTSYLTLPKVASWK